MGWEQLAQDRREEIARLAEILSGRLTEITRLLAEVERLREELSGRHPSYQSALALLFTFVCPEESFDPTQPILMGKRIKDAVARLTGELAAVRRERDEADSDTQENRTYLLTLIAERDAALARETSTLTALIQEHRIVVKETTRHHEPDCPVCALIESVRGVRHE